MGFMKRFKTVIILKRKTISIITELISKLIFFCQMHKNITINTEILKYNIKDQ